LRLSRRQWLSGSNKEKSDYIEQFKQTRQLNKVIETTGGTITTQLEVIEDLKSTTKAQSGIWLDTA
jgi:hypothetical protein